MISERLLGFTCKRCEALGKDCLECANKPPAWTQAFASFNMSPLAYAACRGDLKSVKTHLKNGADANKWQFWAGMTPLLFANFNGHYEVVKCLIENKADVNIPNRGHYSALHSSAKLGYKDLTKLLLRSKADVNKKIGILSAKVDRGKTPLEMAEFHYQNETANLIKEFLEDEENFRRQHRQEKDCEMAEHEPLDEKENSRAAVDYYENSGDYEYLDYTEYADQNEESYHYYDERGNEEKREYSHDELEVSGFRYVKFGDLSKIVQIGEGNFGYTFVATWGAIKGKESIIVIKAPKSNPSKDEESEFSTLMKLPSHPNVLPIIGLCFDFENPKTQETFPSIAIPFLKKKDLKTYLKNKGDLPSESDLINIVLGMARGIAHLHENQIVHRDIALRNFLVSNEGRILTSDFGLSRHIGEKDECYYRPEESGPIPFRWCSPETLGHNKSTKMSDMWMFGVAILELFDPKPFPDSSIVNHLSYINNPEFKLSFPHDVNCPEILSTIAQNCCQKDPKSRITAQQIVGKLQHLEK